MRYTSSGSLVFSVKYPGEILINSLCIYGSSENYIMYVTKGNPFLSFALNTPDGSMIVTFSNTAGQATNLIGGATFESTGQNWFQSLEVPSTSTGLLCYDIVGQGNLRCFTLTGYSIPSTIVAISGLDVFFAASIQGSSDIGLMRASFTTNTILWAKKSACSINGGCSLSYSQTYVDLSQNTIYSLLLFGLTGSVNPYYVVLDLNTGNPKQSVYKVPIVCSAIYGIAKKMTNIYSSSVCSTSLLINIDTINNTFSFYNTISSQVNFRQIIYHSSLDKIFITGSYSTSELYVSLVSPCCIDQHLDLIDQGYTPVEISASVALIDYGTMPVFAYSSSSYAFPANPSPITQLITKDSSNSFESKASYHLDSYSKDGIQSFVHYELYIDVTCALLTSTTITYSFVNYNNESPPSWIQFNETTSKLIFTAPRLSALTKYTIGLNSDLGNGKSAIKLIYLTVEAGPPCFVSNCISCYLNYTDQCETCKSNFSIVNNNKKECVKNPATMDSSTESSQIAALAACGVIAGAAAVLSMMNLSSITVIWAIFNQMRSLILILLTGCYFTDNVKVYLSGMKIFSFNLSFLSIGSLPVAITVVKFFDFNQAYSTIADSGFTSESTFVNCLNMFSTFLLIMLTHALIRLFHWCMCKNRRQSRIERINEIEKQSKTCCSKLLRIHKTRLVTWLWK